MVDESLLPPAGPTPSTPDAARLLEQSSFGPADAALTQLTADGINRYIERQFLEPTSGYPNYGYESPDSSVVCPSGSPSTCFRDHYTPFPLQLRFYQNALTARDQLRQRVAFALSQIFVISGDIIDQVYAMAAYQNMLTRNAFGNFRTLLEEVTLSPAMGEYLDMVNNDKPDPVRGIDANENFARELLQLFSIGVYELNPDGTIRTDAQSQPIPSYTQDTVQNFANVFTGWTYPTRPGATPRFFNPRNYLGRMEAIESRHDTNPKTLLNGVVLPAGQTAAQDLQGALDNIFAHPNVGPFISKQLIQHLVTSNPTPAYVGRIAAVFNDNGSGVRGDLKAVVKAILMDAEARGDAKTDTDYGKLRDPVLFLTGILRALGGTSDGVYPRSVADQMSQDVLAPPSVFSFYPPDYPLPGAAASGGVLPVGPQFAIQNTNTTLLRLNSANRMIFSDRINPQTDVAGAIGTQINFSALLALADNPAALVDRLKVLMLHDTISATMRQTIEQAIAAVPATDQLKRVRTAAYLIATSPDYLVER